METNVTTLRELDLEHLIHPQYNRPGHAANGPLILVRGEGARVWDIQGKEYIDGLASLWNVNVGHGRRELAEAAAAQMSQLAFFSAYNGFSNVPAIELAAKIAELAPANLNAIYFTTAGGETNETAIKTARFYWKQKGFSDKVKIISRKQAYHGLTALASQATGMASFWKDFEPHAPGFIHLGAPHAYRYEPGPDNLPPGAAFAKELEDAILREGADQVAAFIGEPVMGAGGVIVPPEDYWPRVRRICSQYNVLLIADEIITGFGRTGRWFALSHWGVEPDMMAIAKGITSGYMPLGGLMVSDEIFKVLSSLPPGRSWMHAATYSAHPVCCAVALRNIKIIEDEGLVERAAQMGAKLQAGIHQLAQKPIVGEGRGLGMMAALELVRDRQTKQSFEPLGKLGGEVRSLLQAEGLITRTIGDTIALAPPLVITDAELDRAFNILDHVLDKLPV